MNDFTKLICIFLTLALDSSVYHYVDGKINVVPFTTLDDEEICNDDDTNNILSRAGSYSRKSKTSHRLIRNGENAICVSTTAKSNDDIFLDRDIRQRYPIGVIEGDAILISDAEIKTSNVCSKYHAFAVNWNRTGQRWNCLKSFKNQHSSAFSLKSLDPHVVNFFYRAVCVTKDSQLLNAATFYIGYRLCGSD
uniref:Uncharacterized protein n=1 Tax=Romanomermis culicivorax TaxID=13658 RepID=A0A915KL54_ROMCU